MIDRVMTLMAERMTARMGPDQMRAMVGQLLAGMEPAARIAFMREMVRTCIGTLTEGLSPAQRAELAGSILSGMTEELRAASSSR